MKLLLGLICGVLLFSAFPDVANAEQEIFTITCKPKLVGKKKFRPSKNETTVCGVNVAFGYTDIANGEGGGGRAFLFRNVKKTGEVIFRGTADELLRQLGYVSDADVGLYYYFLSFDATDGGYFFPRDGAICVSSKTRIDRTVPLNATRLEGGAIQLTRGTEVLVDLVSEYTCRADVPAQK